MDNKRIAVTSIAELLGDDLTSTLCVSIEKGAKTWVATGMLVHYLESFTDGVIVRDNHKPIGIVGGRDIIEEIVNDPSGGFFDKKIEEVMENNISEVSGKNTYQELMKIWEKTRRAFALIKNEFEDYSSISAKKILEIGKKCNSGVKISEIPIKQIITFSGKDTIGNVMESMLKNKTRRLILEGTDCFINDRMILEKIAEELNYLKNIERFSDVPIKEFNTIQAKKVNEDIPISEVSKMMYNLEHPYIIYKDNVITPWDICQTLLLEKATISN